MAVKDLPWSITMRSALITSATLALIFVAACADPYVDVVLRESTEPVFVAYLVDGGEWQHPAGSYDADDNSFHYEMKVRGDYEVVTVCSNLEGGFSSHEFLDSASASENIVSAAIVSECDAALPTPVNVAGQMAQSGAIYVDGSPSFAIGSASPWNFSFEVPTGSRDLVAVTSAAVLISRLSLTEPLLGDAIDVASLGVPLSIAQVSVSGLSPQDVPTQSEVDLVTRNRTVAVISLLEGSSGDVSYAPDSVLGSGDSQAFVFETGYFADQAATVGIFRDAVVPMSQKVSSVQVDMPPAFATGDVTISAASPRLATWDALPATAYDSLTLTLYPKGAQDEKESVTASSSWVKNKQTNEIAFDGTAPGYPPGDTFTPAVWSLSLASTVDGVSYTTGISGELP